MSLIKLSKSAFFHNIAAVKEAISRAEIAAVLKDNAYGHGLLETASIVCEAGVKNAVVRTLNEAREIADFFEEILVLAESPAIDAPSNASFAVNDLAGVREWAAGTKIHLKIDTGMHRNGVALEAIETAIKTAIDRGLILRGVFSHLRSADALSSELFWQEKNFAAAREKIEKLCASRGVDRPVFHLHASAGIFRSQNAIGCDWARPGLALYGYCDLDFPFKKPDLKPALSLWADRIARRELKAGDRVGYGGAFTAKRDMSIGIYDLGYGDGFLRLNGTEGYKTNGGLSVLGRVSMDSLAADSQLDRVCVLDDAERLAKLRGTISYEVLVRLSAAIKREIV